MKRTLLLLLFILGARLAHAKPWSVECQSVSGSLSLRTTLHSFESRFDPNVPAQLLYQSKQEAGTVFQYLLDTATHRLVIEAIVDSHATPKSDRVLSIMVAWPDEEGDYVTGWGHWIDELHRYDRGDIVTSNPESISCGIDFGNI